MKMLFFMTGEGDGNIYNDHETIYIPLHKVDRLVTDPKGDDYAVVDGQFYAAANSGAWVYSIVDIESTKVMEARLAREARIESAKLKASVRKADTEELRRYLDGKGKLDGLEG